MKSVRRLLALSVAIAGASACSSDSTTNTFAPFALSLSLSPAADTIFVSDTIFAGSTGRFTVSASSLNNPISTPSGIEWSSSDPNIASISQDGTITAHSIGTALITARVNSSKATAPVVVAYRATKLTLTATSLAGVVGDTINVTASAVDPKGVLVPGTAYVFAAADPSIVSVTSTGPRAARLILLKAGNANVVVTAGGQTVSLSGTVQARDFLASPANGAPTGSLVIGAGRDVTCGLVGAGRAYCFGSATLIGIAKDTVCFNDDPATTGTQGCTLIPLRMGQAQNFVSVTVGDSVACAATADNKAYCWGSQTYGALGNGVSTGGSSLTPALVIGATTRTAVSLNRISAGGNHVCALAPSGAAFCWGRDSSYQLGNGDGVRVNSTTPIPVAGGQLFASISSGHDHTCALTQAGVAYCWGDNTYGQLGTGGGNQDSPVAIPGITFSQISSGHYHTCGITTGGSAFCWGDNSVGELGDGDASGLGSSVPVAVATTQKFKSISAGEVSTCAVTTGGVAYCWGDNTYLQLGASIGFGSSSPSPVSGGHTDFVSVTVGGRHACATVAAGGAYCWGSNMLGALGNELQAMVQATPQRVVFPSP